MFLSKFSLASHDAYIHERVKETLFNKHWLGRAANQRSKLFAHTSGQFLNALLKKTWYTSVSSLYPSTVVGI